MSTVQRVRLAAASDVPGQGVSRAVERLNIITRSGTRMDAPWHYASTTDGGKPAYGIDELALDWCLRSGVKLDVRDLIRVVAIFEED